MFTIPENMTESPLAGSSESGHCGLRVIGEMLRTKGGVREIVKLGTES